MQTKLLENGFQLSLQEHTASCVDNVTTLLQMSCNYKNCREVAYFLICAGSLAFNWVCDGFFY